MRFGFVGGSYASETPLISAEQTINFYLEQAESPGARVASALLPTPGLNLFCALPNDAKDTGITVAVRGVYTINGRTFAVMGTHLFELTSSGVGAFTDYGGNHTIVGGIANNFIVDDGLPVTMVAGGTDAGSYPGQLLIASGGAITVFGLAANAFKALTTPPANVLMVEFLDGFFLTLTSGNTFQASAVEDATTWSGLSISNVSVYSDKLLSIIADHRLLWVFGGKRAVAYYTSGGALFPFDVVNGGFLEVGILAQYSAARCNNTIFWLGGDERGESMVVRASGFTPQRVSDHALEYWLQKQTTISDAVGFSTREEGHNFYHLWFPSANATWSLDTDLGVWHRRSSQVTQVQAAHLARCHTFNFGQHLVGDRTSRNIYSMAISNLTDNGTPIIRTRIGPTVSVANNWLFVNEFQVDFEVDLGPIPPLLDAKGNPRDPYAMFSYSGDNGKTWGTERMISLGQAGSYRLRAIDRRLGKYRNFTPKVTISDPIPARIADAFINGTADSQKRLSSRYAEIA